MARAPKYVPEHWDGVLAAIYTWASTTTPLAADWKNQAAPSLALPYIGIGTITPPGPIGLTSPQRARAVRVITVGPAATLYRITIEAVNYDYTTVDGDGAAEIVEGLLDALGVLGSSFFFDASGLVLNIASDDVVTVSANLLEKTALYRVGESEFTLSVDVYASTEGVNPEQAAPYAIWLARSLEDDDKLEALRIAGLAVVEVIGARRPLLIKNASWEDRIGFDVRFRVLTRTGILIDWIESAGEISGTFSGGVTT
jgi:hypothetical protein